MAVKKRARKILRILGAIILLLAVIVVALPVWFPWILRPAAKKFGATHSQFQREGYARFRLNRFSFTNSAGRFEAQQVRALVPTVWVWRRFFGPKSESFLEINSWKYTALERQSAQRDSASSNFQNAMSHAATVRLWLPMAKATNGVVFARNWSVEIPEANWSDGKLSARANLPKAKSWLIIASAEASGLNLKLDSDALDIRATATIAAADETLNLESAVHWLTNRIDLRAEFPGDGPLPRTASARAESFSIPARLLKLGQYKDLVGSLRADWTTNQFTVDLTAKAFPQTTNLPAIDVEVRASGDTNSARIDSAKISAPWLRAELPRQTEILFKPPFLRRPTALNVVADLSQQPWFRARGKLRGEAIFHPSTNTSPQFSFALSGTDVAVRNMMTKTIQLNGTFAWPQLELTQSKIEMGDGSDIDLIGKLDLDSKAIRDGRLNFSGSFGKQFLPRGVSFESATLAARFGGPISALTNSANLTVQNLSLPHAKPLHLEATWNGRGLNFERAQIIATAGASSLQLRGSAELGGMNRFRVTALELSQSNRAELQLQQPFEMTFGVLPSVGPGRLKPGLQTEWSAATEQVSLSGPNRQLSVEANVNWPEEGTFHVAAQGLDTSLVRDFFGLADSEARLDGFAFSGGWTNGPISFRLESKAELKTKEQLSFSADVDVSGGPDGIAIKQLSVSSVTQAVCRVEGSLPMTLKPAATNGLVTINPDVQFSLKLFTEPDSVLWEKLATAAGFSLQKPNLSADLAGTWSRPEGRVMIQADRIQYSRADRPLPAIERVNIMAEMDRDTARVSRCDLSVEGQPIRITAQIPLGQSYWASLKRETLLPDWRTATAQLKIENAKLAAFAAFVPQVLGPQGTASADISLEAGGNFRGEVSVQDARTHPLSDIGAVRNIHARAVLAGRAVTLTSASAEIGGQRVEADGQLELNEQLWRTNGLPIFRVGLRGTNVPLARNPSVLLRSDFDLAVTNSISEPPLITGTVTLRDSLFMADLQSLVPGHTAAPDRRPPYFSIKTEPWSAWRVKVNVQGNSALKVQTPLFRGAISANVKLDGTLRDPIALGQVKIDSGSVTFPFGNLAVKQGFVSLTSEDPFHPQLSVAAAGQRFGYEIKMDASGPADQPIVQLSSVPALASEQIILMLTTGQAPRGIGAASTTGQRAQGLALFVGKNLLSDFGLSSGEDRLSIRSGEQISRSGRATYELEYRLTDRWSVIGGYDRFDQYNLNLKWKVYSK